MCVFVSVCPEPFGETTGPILMKLYKNSLTGVKSCAFQFCAILLKNDVMAAILKNEKNWKNVILYLKKVFALTFIVQHHQLLSKFRTKNDFF